MTSDGYKVSGEYFFEHTETGTPICLYDWKHTTLYDHDGIKPVDFWKLDEEVQFNIGSTNSMAYGFERWIKLTIANKLIYSEIGNVFLTRLSSNIHTPKAKDDLTGTLALRASVIQGINLGKGKINLINFFEAYPTKTVILNVNTLSKVMIKVESISELFDFFTNSPLDKIKTN